MAAAKPSASVVKLRGVPMAVAPWVVSDELWERIEPLLPKVERRFRYPGRKRLPDRQALQGILFVLHTGIAWRHLPLELGFGSRLDLLPAAGRVAAGGRVGAAARAAARRAARGRGDRVVAGGRRRQSRAGEKGGSATGPSPVDRARTGSKHHLLVDATGIPLAWTLTGGNRNDVTQLIPLVDRVPPVRGKVGRPRRRPDATHRRPRLRPRQVPARAAPARHQTRDRPPPDRARLRPRPRPLGRRAHLRLAAPVQAAARPLRPPRTRSTKPSSRSAAASSASGDSRTHCDSSSKSEAER